MEKNAFICPICESLFTRKFSLDYHMKMHFDIVKYICSHREIIDSQNEESGSQKGHGKMLGEVCSSFHNHSDHFKTHVATKHYFCEMCTLQFGNLIQIDRHWQEVHRTSLTNKKGMGKIDKGKNQKDNKNTRTTNFHCDLEGEQKIRGTTSGNVIMLAVDMFNIFNVIRPLLEKQYGSKTREYEEQVQDIMEQRNNNRTCISNDCLFKGIQSNRRKQSSVNHDQPLIKREIDEGSIPSTMRLNSHSHTNQKSQMINAIKEPLKISNIVEGSKMLDSNAGNHQPVLKIQRSSSLNSPFFQPLNTNYQHLSESNIIKTIKEPLKPNDLMLASSITKNGTHNGTPNGTSNGAPSGIPSGIPNGTHSLVKIERPSSPNSSFPQPINGDYHRINNVNGSSKDQWMKIQALKETLKSNEPVVAPPTTNYYNNYNKHRSSNDSDVQALYTVDAHLMYEPFIKPEPQDNTQSSKASQELRSPLAALAELADIAADPKLRSNLNPKAKLCEEPIDIVIKEEPLEENLNESNKVNIESQPVKTINQIESGNWKKRMVAKHSLPPVVSPPPVKRIKLENVDNNKENTSFIAPSMIPSIQKVDINSKPKGTAPLWPMATSQVINTIPTSQSKAKSSVQPINVRSMLPLNTLSVPSLNTMPSMPPTQVNVVSPLSKNAIPLPKNATTMPKNANPMPKNATSIRLMPVPTQKISVSSPLPSTNNVKNVIAQVAQPVRSMPSINTTSMSIIPVMQSPSQSIISSPLQSPNNQLGGRIIAQVAKPTIPSINTTSMNIIPVMQSPSQSIISSPLPSPNNQLSRNILAQLPMNTTSMNIIPVMQSPSQSIISSPMPSPNNHLGGRIIAQVAQPMRPLSITPMNIPVIQSPQEITLSPHIQNIQSVPANVQYVAPSMENSGGLFYIRV